MPSLSPSLAAMTAFRAAAPGRYVESRKRDLKAVERPYPSRAPFFLPQNLSTSGPERPFRTDEINSASPSTIPRP